MDCTGIEPTLSSGEALLSNQMDYGTAKNIMYADIIKEH
jgi:hypothetical protein